MSNIDNIRAENARLQTQLMQERDAVKRLEHENKDLQSKLERVSSAIIFAAERSSEWDHSMRKLYELDIQRTRLLYARMERVIDGLYAKYPELKKESRLKETVDKFKNFVSGNLSQGFEETSQADEPIKKLLNNILNFMSDEKPSVVLHREKPISSALDAINSQYAQTPSSSGFDINEALNPTEDLEEILKSFNLQRKSGRN